MKNGLKEVRARLSIEVLVDCPNCDTQIDLLNPDDTNDRNLNEEGNILKQACPDGCWSEQHPFFKAEGVTCSCCKKSFNVRDLEW